MKVLLNRWSFFFSISSVPERNYALFPKWAGHGTSVTHIGEIIKCKGGDREGTRAVSFIALSNNSQTMDLLINILNFLLISVIDD